MNIRCVFGGIVCILLFDYSLFAVQSTEAVKYAINQQNVEFFKQKIMKLVAAEKDQKTNFAEILNELAENLPSTFFIKCKLAGAVVPAVFAVGTALLCLGGAALCLGAAYNVCNDRHGGLDVFAVIAPFIGLGAITTAVPSVIINTSAAAGFAYWWHKSREKYNVVYEMARYLVQTLADKKIFYDETLLSDNAKKLVYTIDAELLSRFVKQSSK